MRWVSSTFLAITNERPSVYAYIKWQLTTTLSDHACLCFSQLTIGLRDCRPAQWSYAVHDRCRCVSGVDNYKWILYGDDDTVFFVENVLQTLQGLDYRQPYFISDSLWFPQGGDGKLFLTFCQNRDCVTASIHTCLLLSVMNAYPKSLNTLLSTLSTLSHKQQTDVSDRQWRGSWCACHE